MVFLNLESKTDFFMEMVNHLQCQICEIYGSCSLCNNIYVISLCDDFTEHEFLCLSLFSVLSALQCYGLCGILK